MPLFSRLGTATRQKCSAVPSWLRAADNNSIKIFQNWKHKILSIVHIQILFEALTFWIPRMYDYCLSFSNVKREGLPGYIHLVLDSRLSFHFLEEFSVTTFHSHCVAFIYKGSSFHLGIQVQGCWAIWRQWDIIWTLFDIWQGESVLSSCRVKCTLTSSHHR